MLEEKMLEKACAVSSSPFYLLFLQGKDMAGGKIKQTVIEM